jgi:hypothetical protein
VCELLLIDLVTLVVTGRDVGLGLGGVFPDLTILLEAGCFLVDVGCGCFFPLVGKAFLFCFLPTGSGVSGLSGVAVEALLLGDLVGLAGLVFPLRLATTHAMDILSSMQKFMQYNRLLLE